MQKLAELLAFVQSHPAQPDMAAAYQTGYEAYDGTARALGLTARDPASFATYLALLLAETGEQPEVLADGEDMIVRVGGWRRMASSTDNLPWAFPIWTQVWEGALAAHNTRLALRLDQRMDQGDAVWQWRVCAATPLDA